MKKNKYSPKKRHYITHLLFFTLASLFVIGCTKTENVNVNTTLTVASKTSESTITVKSGTLQMMVKDGEATVNSPEWSVTETDGSATTKAKISKDGLLTAMNDGTVRVKAKANNKEGTFDVTITNQGGHSSPSYELQARVGAIGSPTSTPLKANDAVEINPNGLESLAAFFVLLADNTPQTEGVSYSIEPDLVSDLANGVSIVNQGGTYVILITPATYSISTDKTYLLTASLKITSGSDTTNIEVTRNFVIKGKEDHNSDQHTTNIQGMIVGSSGHFTTTITTTTTGTAPTHMGTTVVTLDDESMTLNHHSASTVEGHANKMLHTFGDPASGQNHIKIEVTTTTVPSGSTATTEVSVPALSFVGHSEMKAIAELQSSTETSEVDKTVMYEGIFTQHFQVNDGDPQVLYEQHYNLIVSKDKAKLVNKLTETEEQINSRLSTLNYELLPDVLSNYLIPSISEYVVTTKTATQIIMDLLDEQGQVVNHPVSLNIDTNTHKLSLAGNVPKEDFIGLGDKTKEKVEVLKPNHFFVNDENEASIYYKIVGENESLDTIHSAAGISTSDTHEQTEAKLKTYISENPSKFEKVEEATAIMNQYPELEGVKIYGSLDSDMVKLPDHQ